MIDSVIPILLVVFAMVLAGLLAGAETGIYQMSRIRLRLGIERRQMLYNILGKVLHDSSGLLISIIVGTNLAHYVITSVITFLLLSKLDNVHMAELFATLITAPMLFIFCELIPKNIFFSRADTFMPYVSPVLMVLKKIFTWCGIIGLLKIISAFFAKITGSAVSSQTALTSVRTSHIKAIFKETHDEGILSTVQADIISHIEGISHHGIKSVMTPISRVRKVSVNAGREELLDILKRSPFTRLVVYESSESKIIGFINIYEVLNSSEPFTDLRGFIKPVRRLSADTIVTDAISIMQQESRKIVLVTRPGTTNRTHDIGIITMKDLAEELLGELVEW